MSTEIPNLLELQLQLRRAVLGGDTAGLVAAIRGDGPIRQRDCESIAITHLRRSAPSWKALSQSSAALWTSVSLRTPRMNTCANTR